MFFPKNFSARLALIPKKHFSHRSGPYNPNRYKDYLIPKTLPKKEEIHPFLSSVAAIRPSPIRNVRHINPVRESGPLPAYDGAYTMEDIRKVIWNTSVGRDFCYSQMNVDEVMRRVPGITRKEVEHIVKLGLTPEEQVDYAYLAYTIGLDVFYLSNQVFVARQVVTNSKGEKVEVLWNAQAYEDLAQLQVGFAPVLENVDYHWEIFLWGDPPLKAINDMDLGVPNTWFEYEQETWNEMTILEDQMNIPEDIRPYNTPRNPHARSELWKSQEQLQMEEDMKDPKWTPGDLKYNIYQKEGFRQKNEVVNSNDRPQA